MACWSKRNCKDKAVNKGMCEGVDQRAGNSYSKAREQSTLFTNRGCRLHGWARGVADCLDGLADCLNGHCTKKTRHVIHINDDVGLHVLFLII